MMKNTNQVIGKVLIWNKYVYALAWDKNQFCSRRNWGKKHEFAWKNYVPQKVINFSSLNAYAKLNLPGNEKRITIKKIRNWYSISCYAFDKSCFGERVIIIYIYNTYKYI